jgi:hypothetical protein
MRHSTFAVLGCQTRARLWPGNRQKDRRGRANPDFSGSLYLRARVEQTFGFARKQRWSVRRVRTLFWAQIPKRRRIEIYYRSEGWTGAGQGRLFQVQSMERSRFSGN